MKKHLAHALRRTARRMIAWSNRLDGPHLSTAAGKALYDAGSAFDRAGDRVTESRARLILAEERLAEARRRAALDETPAQLDARLRQEASEFARRVVGPPPKLFGRR